MDADFGENNNSRENKCFEEPRKTWTPKSALLLGVVLALAGVAALGVDGPVARWVKNIAPHPKFKQKMPTSPSVSPQNSSHSEISEISEELNSLLTWSEGFGHALGIVLLAALVYQLDPAHRRQLPRLLTMALGSGLGADGIKLLVSRVRPRAFDLTQPIWESFTGLLPLGLGGSVGQSFPSSHAATAVGWALGLGWLYPRGRWSFLGLAFLVMCQRIQYQAHFVSDTLVGAAVGCLIGALFLPNGWWSRPFDQWEKTSKKPHRSDLPLPQPTE